MPDFVEITAKDNPLIKLVCSIIGSRSARKEHGLFVLEGLRICKDAADNAIEFDKLIVTKQAYDKHTDDINRLALNAERCVSVTEQLFKKMSDTESPQGILALARFPKILGVVSDSGRYVALENIADPSNLGAVSRTAEALGASGIVLSVSGCDPYSPKALRASMGTLLRMPLFITDDIISFAKENSLRAIGCVVDSGAAPLDGFKFSDGDMIIIGNEANGLKLETKNSCDALITIPMSGRAESLNAAAAAAIVAWEMTKKGNRE